MDGANVHHRVWDRGQAQREWRPLGTYALLGTMAAFFLAQVALAGRAESWHDLIFVIDSDWYLRPWTLVTSTLAHDPGWIWHIVFNGLVLFFFGPVLERLVGLRPFVILFLVAGAASGVVQVHLSDAFGTGAGALGASGAINFVLGTLVVLMPKQKILLWGVVPLPFWLAMTAFVVLDILGAFNPYDRVGNFAHLAGAAIGLAYGVRLRGKAQQRRAAFGR